MSKVKEPLMHLVRRADISKPKAWGIRIGAFVLSFLACAIISTLLSNIVNFGNFFKYFFNGIFGTKISFWAVLGETAILLIIALAVTPCFKMRYWNIGGEGQVLMGALGSAVAISFLSDSLGNTGTIIVSMIFGIVFAVVWSVIPALFKAKWNTNETLLTLMFNYIAVCIVSFFIKKVDPKTTGSLYFRSGFLPKIANNSYLIIILVVAVITVIMAIYLKYSKHGYELTVVGESENTARYVGINTKAVIIRTLVLCGVLCGIIGFLLVSAKNHNLSDTTVGGKGFTAILISWLAHFNPLAMVLCSFLVAFLTKGSTSVSDYGRFGSSYPSVMTGIFFFFIVASEFFINYRIIFRHKEKKILRPDVEFEDETMKGASEIAVEENNNVSTNENVNVTENANENETPSSAKKGQKKKSKAVSPDASSEKTEKEDK